MIPRRKVYASVLFLFLSVFVYLAFTMKRTFVRYDGRIPYVWPTALNQTLMRHLSTQPARRVLLIAGPYQCGKSRALRIAADAALRQRRLAITIDASRAQSPRDVAEAAKAAVYRALVDLLPLVSQSRLRDAARAFDPESHSAPDDLPPAAAALYAQLAHTIDESVDAPLSAARFIDDLEMLAKHLRPALFVHGLDALRTAAPAQYRAVRARAERVLLYGDSVPIACEVRDSRFFADGDARAHAEVYYVGELTQLPSALIVSARVFSSVELAKIAAAFGGHGGTLERVFEALKAGAWIDEAVAAQQSAVEAHLRRVLRDGVPQRELSMWCAMNGTMAFADTQSIDALAPLLASGHLVMADGRVVRMAHKGVFRALCGKNI